MADEDAKGGEDQEFKCPQTAEERKKFLMTFLAILTELDQLHEIMAMEPYPAKNVNELRSQHQDIQTFYSVVQGRKPPSVLMDMIREDRPDVFLRFVEYFSRYTGGGVSTKRH